MARRPRRPPKPSPRSAAVVTGLCLLAVVIEIAVLPGAASPFRAPKSALALAGITLLVAWAVARGIGARSVELPRGPVSLTLVTLPILYGLSSLWSPDAARSVATAVGAQIWIVGICWIATLSDHDRRRAARWMTAGVGLSIAVMLLQTVGFRPLGVVGAESSGRLAITGLTGNPADLAMAAMLVLPLALEAFADAPSPAVRWGVPVGLLAVTGMTQTLTGLVAAAAFIGVWLLQRRSMRTWVAAFVLTIGVVAAGLATGLGGRLETVTGHVARGEWYQLLSARADGWTAAVEMIRRSPIGGVGAGGYSIEFYPARLAWLEAHDRSGSRGELATHFEWAHCDPLQLAAETGLLGAVWMVTLLALLWRARPRGDPVVAQMAAAAAPFALLHYPLSLAVGLLPLAMATARVVSTEPRVTLAPASRVVRRVSVVAALLITLAVAAWQARRIAVDVWQGAILAAFDRTQAMPVDQQRRALAALEAELSRRAASLPSHRAWLLRKIGLVRLARGDAAAAEAALRQSMELWPHEETELGLGVAMDRQGRRTEALAALGRVLRVNPALIRLIPDEDLRRAAEDLVTARRRTHRATGG